MLGERLALARRHLLCHQSGSYEVEAVKCVAVSLHTSHFMPFLQCKEVKETQNTRTHTHSISDKMLCVCLCVSVRGRVCAFVSFCLHAYVLVWESVSLNTMGLLRSFPVRVRVRARVMLRTHNQSVWLPAVFAVRHALQNGPAARSNGLCCLYAASEPGAQHTCFRDAFPWKHHHQTINRIPAMWT